jgi:hypothetical protein
VETDLCVSDAVVKEQADIKRKSLEPYDTIKYHLGSWIVNYFRNILPPDVNYFQQLVVNQQNIYDYPRDSERRDKIYESDDNSLIYGSYFVLMFKLGRVEKRIKSLELLKSPSRGAMDDPAGEEPTTSEEEPITPEEQESNLPSDDILYTNPVKIEDITINTKKY